jgi:hypothetical protein
MISRRDHRLIEIEESKVSYSGNFWFDIAEPARHECRRGIARRLRFQNLWVRELQPYLWRRLSCPASALFLWLFPWLLGESVTV